MQDLGGALVDQGDQQVLGSRALAQAAGQRHGATLGLPVQVGRAAGGNITGRGNHRAQRPARTAGQGRGGRPASPGDAHQEMHRAAAVPELARKLEAALDRFQVRAAQLLARHHPSMPGAG